MVSVCEIEKFCSKFNVEYKGKHKSGNRLVLLFRCKNHECDSKVLFERRGYEVRNLERGCPTCAFNFRRKSAKAVLESLRTTGFTLDGVFPKSLKIPMSVKCIDGNHFLGAKLFGNLIESKRKFSKLPCPICRLNAKNKEQTKLLSVLANKSDCILESEYRGQFYPIVVRHKTEKYDHTFPIVPKYVLKKKIIKCDICFPGTRKTPLDKLRQQANPQLIFLFSDYENDRSEVKVQCVDCFEEYPTSIANIKDGVGCRFCQGKEPLTHKMMSDWLKTRNELAIDRSIPVWSLEKFYRDNESKPICKFHCESHGPFTCNAIQVRAENAGCDKCGRISASMKNAHSFETLCKIFKSRFPNWKLNTTKREYLAAFGNSARKLSYTCDKDHSNTSLINNLLYTIQSCRDCIILNRSKVAAICISTIEDLLSVKIKKEFAISHKNFQSLNGFIPKRPLYVDGFCEKYRFGFEYQGDQHFRFIPYFHDSNDDFERQKAYDKLKKRFFEKKGFALIEISENELTVKSSEKEFIRVISAKLAEIGIKIDVRFD